MSFLTVLPLAIVMVAGPQFLTAIFLATSERWRRNSAAYVIGAGLAISIVVTVAFVAGAGVIGGGSPRVGVHLAILVLLLYAMVHTYRTREEADTPGWMSRLVAASPRFSFRLGFLLLGFFPTDLVTSVAVGSSLAATGAPLGDAAGFVALTLTLLALPAVVLAAFGDRAEKRLPAVRDWMETNSWLVNEVVLLLFVGITVSNVVG